MFRFQVSSNPRVRLLSYTSPRYLHGSGSRQSPECILILRRDLRSSVGNQHSIVSHASHLDSNNVNNFICASTTSLRRLPCPPPQSYRGDQAKPPLVLSTFLVYRYKWYTIDFVLVIRLSTVSEEPKARCYSYKYIPLPRLLLVISFVRFPYKKPHVRWAICFTTFHDDRQVTVGQHPSRLRQ